MISPFFIELVDSAKECAAKYENLEILILAPSDETKVEEQIRILEDLIQKGVDIISISAGNWEAVRPTLIKAREKGIEIIIQDRLTPLEDVDAISLIGIDEVLGGEVAGKWALKVLDKKGNVVMLEGVAGDYWTVREGKGFDNIVEQYPDIKVVARQPANWERARGMEVMENILQANKDIDLVFGMNDNMALGALQAIENAGLLGKIKVIGYNAQQDALEAISEGRLDASVAKQPGNIGRMIIEDIVVKIIEGKRNEIKPVIYVSPALVTKENLRDYLKK